MDHLQQDFDSRLGALELGAMAATDSDAALEIAAHSVQPATPFPIRCGHIEDGILEATSLDLGPNASRQMVQTFCRYV